MSILEKILSFLFPTNCIVCNTEGPDICTKCLMSFEESKPSNYDWIVSVWNYRDPNVEKVMRHIKNYPNKRVAEIFSTKLFSDLKKYNESSNEKLRDVILVPIPIGRARFRQRGYNQSLLLARPLASLLHRKIDRGILVKAKQTKKQGTTKNKSERIHNIEGSFQVMHAKKIKNRDIVLVDDITTTGTTLFEARKVLLAAGAKNVIAITVAN
ncbi:MAG: competence protein competence protein ComFC [Patescibacteria group bacterium]|nr:competence protein competence protein ComFC [Patescibacteria group bacterium]